MARPAKTAEISERAQRLLRVLIEQYVREGEPVGSRTLARASGLDLSPATVRNVMADLEELGFVCSPHTSAGRVPTAQGYRLFVDSLLKVEPLTAPTVEQLRRQLDIDAEPGELVESVSNLLSSITRMAGVVTLPRQEHAALRRIDFLPLSQRRVLVILIMNEREVQNRIIQTERDYSPAELEAAAAFLNEQFAGKDLAAVRSSLIDEMQRARDGMNQIMNAAVSMAEQVFIEDRNAEGEEVVVAGQTNLMDFRELGDVEKLRQLFEAFNQKRELLHLLDQCLCADGVQIFIGEESGYQVLDECSVVTAPYKVEGEVLGVLGVIGPTRMAYERVIPIVDATARLLGAALNPKT
ncbi:heat-inducible transcriptional repressor HrcA [Thiohalobacter sp. IOR34]|uniref:heat-inducible transcriptional repressor HrcA n=1 Tax=Thiohalobacter sp. IOR34 TaxID=3057176 RepID=UPI0025AF9CC5|nr:heat-inducible transcriptional repressor HrcA [Thiohalobacter sp. IOR34]WJW76455.1 heat-inducible transcriptional repressor HrcA [Thiohalobacter sp. IOR34]